MVVTPEALEVGDHGIDLVVVQSIAERRHRKLRRPVEWVSLAVADDLSQLVVAMPPGVAAVVVGWGWEIPDIIRALPV